MRLSSGPEGGIAAMLALLLVVGGCESSPDAEQREQTSPAAVAESSEAAEDESAPRGPTSDDAVHDAGAPGSKCRMTEVMESTLASEEISDALAASPMAPALAAASEGGRMPRLSPDAAEWVYTEQERTVESLRVGVWLACPELVEQLLDLGTPPDGLVVDHYERARSPALEAAVQEEWEIVLLLLEAGADPVRPTPGELDKTVLDQAVIFGRPELVEEVLDHVLDDMEMRDAAQPDGPIAQAVGYAGDPETLRLLLDTGVRPPIPALRMAAEKDRQPEIFQSLHEAAQDHNYSDVDPAQREHLCSLNGRDIDEHYRYDDVERLLSLLGDDLPC